MDTIVSFAAFCLGFVPFLSLVAIALAVFWAATKLIPSLGAWMSNTDGMVETDAERYDRERNAINQSFDQYI